MTIIGPDELKSLPFLSGADFSASPIPFSKEVLAQYEVTHLLIFTPCIDFLTINWLREQFGTDPSREPCMYNQDWYIAEDFAAKTILDGKWHLIPKSVREDGRAQQPEAIEKSLQGEQFATAVTYTFTFFAWWLLKGEVLWKHDFLWCSDKDHNGDRIYVGRYEDPTGVNKNGFNIHRHLFLRPAYSAAPEILS